MDGPRPPPKAQVEYVKLDPNFKPRPKNGHLSEPNPEWIALRPVIDEQMEAIWGCTDWKTYLGARGLPDAPLPPGSPERGRDVATEKMQFPARDGHLVELLVYKSPKVQPNAPLMYRMHGGGWSVGNHETDGAENVHAAALHNVVVVSVDYRMYPEHRFPVPLQDCYDGLLWCKNNAQSLGVDPEKIILAGSSAGANLAACLGLEARNTGVTGILAQVIHFPIACHPKLFPHDKYELASYVQNNNAGVLSALQMEDTWDNYLPDITSDYRHSPLLAESHAGLPPTLLQCGGLDVLRDEGLAYGEALANAGVDLDVAVHKGVPHCFPSMLLESEDCKEFYRRYNRFLDRFLKPIVVSGLAVEWR